MNHFSAKRDEPSSPSHIASWIATNALLANSQIFAQEFNSKSIQFYSVEHIDKDLAATSLLYRPITEAATRGVMVERGLIDLDEVDLGWIFSQAISSEITWHTGQILNLGKLLLYLPIASATGFIISESQEQENYIDIEKIPEFTELFLENSTPEDTVNLYTALYENQKHLDLLLKSGVSSLHEGIEDLLEEEVNLLDFFKALKNDNIVFEELSENYPMSTSYGFSAFREIINEEYTFKDAIIHTYVSLLSHKPDSYIHDFYGRVSAYTIRQMAKDTLGLGSIFTEEGRKSIAELNDYILHETPLTKPKSIGDITTNVCFLATLSGIRP